MLSNKYVKSRNCVKVTFELPADVLPQEVTPEEISVVGEFNDWDPSVNQMQPLKSRNAYQTTVEFEPGAAYQFRYLVNGELWLNDPAAHDYIPNGLGAENSVVLASA